MREEYVPRNTPENDGARMARFGDLLITVMGPDDAQGESALNEILALINDMENTRPMEEIVYARSVERAPRDLLHSIYQHFRPRSRREGPAMYPQSDTPVTRRLDDIRRALREHDAQQRSRSE